MQGRELIKLVWEAWRKMTTRTDLIGVFTLYELLEKANGFKSETNLQTIILTFIV